MDDFVERIKEEAAKLLVNISRLEVFRDPDIYKNLSFVEKTMLTTLLQSMREYYTMLCCRISYYDEMNKRRGE